MRPLAIALLASLLAAAPNAQLPNAQLMDGYQQMYDLDFDAAHRSFQNYSAAQPTDPMGPVSDAAAYLFFEFQRLNILRSEFLANDSSFFAPKRLAPDPRIKSGFEAALARAKMESEELLRKQPGDRSALLANVIRIALHADYLALIEKDRLQALTEIKQARQQADALIKLHPDCYDAYLAAAVENYLLSQKVAPVRMILRWGGAQTDRKEGIAKLQIVARQGQSSPPYAIMIVPKPRLC